MKKRMHASRCVKIKIIKIIMIIIKFFNEESLITAKGAFREGPQETITLQGYKTTRFTILLIKNVSSRYSE